MTVEVKELQKIEVQVINPIIEVKPKLSDYIEAQPLDRFSSGAFRYRETGKMCGVGHILNYYGFDWKEDNDALWHSTPSLGNTPLDYYRSFAARRDAEFLFKYQHLIDQLEFDRTYRSEGPQAAKDYVINTLRSKGL